MIVPFKFPHSLEWTPTQCWVVEKYEPEEVDEVPVHEVCFERWWRNWRRLPPPTRTVTRDAWWNPLEAQEPDDEPYSTGYVTYKTGLNIMCRLKKTSPDNTFRLRKVRFDRDDPEEITPCAVFGP